MAHDVAIVRTAEFPTAVVKADVNWREYPSLWGPMLDDVWAFLRATPGLRTDGHNIMLYRDNEPDSEVAVEVGVQVVRPFEPVGRVVPSTVPATEAATTVHSGPASEIGAAHDAVVGWCSSQDRELTGVRWEIYGDPDPTTGNFDVAVYWQLA
jgi:effector-binding domain-containing protein